MFPKSEMPLSEILSETRYMHAFIYNSYTTLVSTFHEKLLLFEKQSKTLQQASRQNIKKFRNGVNIWSDMPKRWHFLTMC